jgi:hypothetical protein
VGSSYTILAVRSASFLPESDKCSLILDNGYFILLYKAWYTTDTSKITIFAELTFAGNEFQAS